MKPCCFRWPIPELSTGRPWRRSVSGSAVFDRKEPNRMTPELNKTERLPEEAGPDATRDVARAVTQRIRTDAVEPPAAAEREETRTPFGSLRDAYTRARDGRKRGQPEKP